MKNSNNRLLKLDAVLPFLKAGRRPEDYARAPYITLDGRGAGRRRFCTVLEASGWGMLAGTIWGAVLMAALTEARLDNNDDFVGLLNERARCLPDADGLVDFAELCRALGINVPWPLTLAAYRRIAGLGCGDFFRTSSTVMVPEYVVYDFILTEPGDRARMIVDFFIGASTRRFHNISGWFGRAMRMFEGRCQG